MSEMNFQIEKNIDVWKDYGVTEKIGFFENLPRRYKVVEVRTNKKNENVVKSPEFIPLPNSVAQTLVNRLATEFNLEVQRQEESGTKYLAVLQAPKETMEVSVGDVVAWGLIVSNNVVGSFRVNSHLLRLKCTNGLILPEDSEVTTVQKSYDVEQIYDSLKSIAQELQNRFEEEIEFLKRLRQYRMNRMFAEVLAHAFPKPIIEGLVTVKKVDGVKIVEDFTNTDLYDAYQTVTYNLSHRQTASRRPLSLGTKLEWGSEATRLFMEEIQRQQEERRNARNE